MTDIPVSRLVHSWLVDIDGTILAHNRHKYEGDQLLPGVKEFWNKIPTGDRVILLSARCASEEKMTLSFLDELGLRYDHAIFGLPTGERILINDEKPGGLRTALSVNVARDVGLAGLQIAITED